MGVDTEATQEAAITAAVQHYFTAVAANDPVELARATFATFEFVDRLVLLEVDGRWQIVAKAFHRAAK